MRAALSSRSVTTTVAPGTAAPAGSRTTPKISPAATCPARAGDASRQQAATIHFAILLRLYVGLNQHSNQFESPRYNSHVVFPREPFGGTEVREGRSRLDGRCLPMIGRE